MTNVLSAINRTIPISLFNRGLAGKIFGEIKKSGTKVVMKNNAAECVLVSPDEYVSMMDELNDARLLLQANARMEHFDAALLLSEEEVNHMLGIREEELAGFDEVALE